MTVIPMASARRADVIVVGSGAAGLTTAATARELGLRVLVITKAAAGDSNTRWAQGGIAAVMPAGEDVDSFDDDVASDEDTVTAHVRDTLRAGVGLCDPDVTRAILAEGQDAIRLLIQRGMWLDREGASMTFARGREGGHSTSRILHAGGDRTGRRLSETLLSSLTGAQSGVGTVELLERHIVMDLLRTPQGDVAGVSILNSAGQLGQAMAPAVVLATGGLGQLFTATTNPAIATADGFALALRAGASVADIEAIQIHPTALAPGTQRRGQTPLITEALRGAGGVLVDGAGQRVMEGIHAMGDLAPRDIVATQIARRLESAPGGVADHVYLDARCITPVRFRRDFPQVLKICLDHGIHPSYTLIPVAPAAHYVCGGIVTAEDGRCEGVRGLYAVGEVARTGLHGANRLAGNGLLEAVVVGARAARSIYRDLRAGNQVMRPGTIPSMNTLPVVIPRALVAPRAVVQATMTRHVGLSRSAAGLAVAHQAVMEAATSQPLDTPRRIEDASLTLMALAVIAAADAREESRGCHRRSDYPDTDHRFGDVMVRIGLDAEGRPRSVLGPLLRSVG